MITFEAKRNFMKKLGLVILSLTVLLMAGTYLFLQQEIFGAKAEGDRLARMKQSPNFKDGQFRNLSETPALAEGYSYPKIMYDFLFKKFPNGIPVDSIPSVANDLKAIPKHKNYLVWFGHSSYLIQADGLTFLVDPVLSGYASPIKRFNKAFKGSDRYDVGDLPAIDFLIITHDHYDHLDLETVKKLKAKVGKVVLPLGVGAHLERWGYDSTALIEKDWGDSVDLGQGFTIHFTPARHFSGRTLKRNTTLWTSYVLETPSKRIFLGGDSGYDTHFAEIGRRFGNFDLAVLENGQYNEAWRYIHTLPEEVLKASLDLNARRLFPVHSAKFKLGQHPWNEPLVKITELNKAAKLNITTPMIGELLDLDNEEQEFSRWWEHLK
jgi:L-ascorbate metabolism protein UlaG (beta-lactamase superfamily)